MAESAVVRKMEPCFVQRFRRGCKGIVCGSRVRGNRQMPRVAGERHFQSAGLGARAETVVDQRRDDRQRHARERNEKDEDESAAFHGVSSPATAWLFTSMLSDQGRWSYAQLCTRCRQARRL